MRPWWQATITCLLLAIAPAQLGADGRPGDSTRLQRGRALEETQGEPGRGLLDQVGGDGGGGLGVTLTNETAPAIISHIATPRSRGRRVVVLVVFTFEHGSLSTTKMVGNWAAHMYRLGILHHVLMLTADPATQSAALDLGLRVYLDQAIDPAVKKRLPGARNSIHDIQKHWWSWKALELGYSVLYSDVDAVHFKNPLLFFAASADQYDLQGLTDDAALHHVPVGVLALWPCGLYRVAAEANTISGAFLADLNLIRERNISESLPATSPCQSTGYWMAQPTEATIRFFFTLSQRISYHVIWQWEQAAFNDLIMGFLIGVGEEGPIRYRLLPNDKFSNVGVWERRRQEGRPTSQAILIHAGGVYGFEDKSSGFGKYGLWEEWDPRQKSGFVAPRQLWTGLEQRHLGAGLVAAIFLAFLACSTGRAAARLCGAK